MTDLRYLRNSRCLFYHPTFSVSFVIYKVAKSFSGGFQVLIFQPDDPSPPITLWLGRLFIPRIFAEYLLCPDTLLVLGTQHSENLINTPSSCALCSSLEDKIQTEKNECKVGGCHWKIRQATEREVDGSGLLSEGLGFSIVTSVISLFWLIPFQKVVA